MNNELTFLHEAAIALEQIDYNSLVNSLSPVVFLYATNKFYQNYKLQKKIKPKYVKIKESNVKETNKNIDYDNLIKEEFYYIIDEFIKVIKSKIPESNLNIFYSNINSIKIKEEKPLFIKPNVIADYDNRKNKIRIFKKESYTVIYHELFHMASSYYRDGMRYSGFKQTSIRGKIGQGINEGYTQLLTERYFGHTIKGVYDYESFIASNLDTIVTKKKMECLYFNADLKGLINELSKYASYDDIIKFVLNIDFINTHIKDKNPSKKEQEILADIFVYNHQFLLKTYANKLKNQVENNIMDEEQMKEKLIKYTNPLGLSKKIYNIRYRTLSKEFIANTLDEMLTTNLKKVKK